MTLAQLEASTADRIIARRNYFLGLWAGQKLGLNEEGLADYIDQLMDADIEVDGPSQVIDRIDSDFRNNGIADGRDAVIAELARTEREVRAELLATD